MPIPDTVGALKTPFVPRPAGATEALKRFGTLPKPNLEWNATVERETAHRYERVKNVVPTVEWPFFAPCARAINALNDPIAAAKARRAVERMIYPKSQRSLSC